MVTPWSARIDTPYLPFGDLPPMGLSAANLPAVRASLDERRAEEAPGLDHAGVTVTERTIGSARPVPVRVYRPDGRDERPPVVVYLHSGGYLLGNLDTDHRRCLDLVRLTGCVLVSVDYRLAPEHPFPAGLDDAFAVLTAVAGDADLLGTDPSRTAVAGSSAGAGLAAALAVRARDAGVELRHQSLHQPMLDRRCSTPSMTEFVDTPYFDATSARFAWAAYAEGNDPATPYLSPAETADLTGLPPAHVTCSEIDPLRDEAVDHALRLARAGVRTDLRLLSGTCHGFDSVAPSAPLSRAIVEEQATALAHDLRR